MRQSYCCWCWYPCRRSSPAFLFLRLSSVVTSAVAAELAAFGIVVASSVAVSVFLQIVYYHSAFCIPSSHLRLDQNE